jgi:hypothetical protein
MGSTVMARMCRAVSLDLKKLLSRRPPPRDHRHDTLDQAIA